MATSDSFGISVPFDANDGTGGDALGSIMNQMSGDKGAEHALDAAESAFKDAMDAEGRAKTALQTADSSAEYERRLDVYKDATIKALVACQTCVRATKEYTKTQMSLAAIPGCTGRITTREYKETLQKNEDFIEGLLEKCTKKVADAGERYLKHQLESDMHHNHEAMEAKEAAYAAAHGGAAPKRGGGGSQTIYGILQQTVIISGVKSQPHLNGEQGTVVGGAKEKDGKARWQVYVEKTAKKYSLKEECLTVLSASSTESGRKADEGLRMFLENNPVPAVAVGSVVLITGAVKKPKLNGVRGKVLSRVELDSNAGAGAVQYWQLLLPTKKKAKVAEHHLVVVADDTFVESNVSSKHYQPCEHCNMERPTKKCGKCGVVNYCCGACQKKDWKRHKLWCCLGPDRREFITFNLAQQGACNECPITARIENSREHLKRVTEFWKSASPEVKKTMGPLTEDGELLQLDSNALDNIAKSRDIRCVLDGAGNPDFSYTIGSSTRGKHEFIIFRKQESVVNEFLSRVSSWSQRSIFEIGETPIYLEGVVGSMPPGMPKPPTRPPGATIPAHKLVCKPPKFMEMFGNLGLAGGGGFALKLVPCSAAVKKWAADGHTCHINDFVAARLVPIDYKLVHVLVPDMAGLFPGDKGCNMEFFKDIPERFMTGV